MISMEYLFLNRGSKMIWMKTLYVQRINTSGPAKFENDRLELIHGALVTLPKIWDL